MKKALSILIYVFLAIAVTTCGDDPVTPPELQPGRRDYVWERDTVIIPYNSFEELWGASIDDAWILARGGLLTVQLWHFDGSEITTDSIGRSLDPSGIWGLNRNNVWISGGERDIWHYNGSEWYEHYLSDDPEINFEGIWGDSPSNIFATGFKGFNKEQEAVLAHYDGNTWELIDIPVIQSIFSKIRRVKERSEKYYILGAFIPPHEPDSMSIFEYYNGNLKEIYKDRWNYDGMANIEVINNELYFVTGHTINKYINNEFVPIFSVEDRDFGQGIMGRSEKDIIIRMEDGIAHYNGTDVEYIYQFEESIFVRNGYVFKDGLLWVGYNLSTGENIILKGTLK